MSCIGCDCGRGGGSKTHTQEVKAARVTKEQQKKAWGSQKASRTVSCHFLFCLHASMHAYSWGWDGWFERSEAGRKVVGSCLPHATGLTLSLEQHKDVIGAHGALFGFGQHFGGGEDVHVCVHVCVNASHKHTRIHNLSRTVHVRGEENNTQLCLNKRQQTRARTLTLRMMLRLVSSRNSTRT